MVAAAAAAVGRQHCRIAGEKMAAIVGAERVVFDLRPGQVGMETRVGGHHRFGSLAAPRVGRPAA